jgi:choline dehydrogenase
LPARDLELVFAPVLFVEEGACCRPRHGFTSRRPPPTRPAEGQIAVRFPDPLQAPAIRPGYLSDPHGADLAVLIAGMRLARRIARAPALEPWAGELGPGPRARSDDELAAWIRAKTQTFYQPVGTCALGDGELAVADCQLRVYGLEALRVIDASVMPRIVRGHTQPPPSRSPNAPPS